MSSLGLRTTRQAGGLSTDTGWGCSMQCDRDQTEDGFALVITLVLLLLLTMTGVGILYIGAEETLIMRNTELGLRFRLASESVLRRGVTEIEWGEYHTLPVGEVIEWTEEYRDRKSTRLNSSHVANSYDVFCLKKKNGN